VFGQIGVTDIGGYINTLNTVNAQVGAVTGTHTTLQGLVDALSALNTGSLSTLSPSVQDIVFGQIGVTDIASYINTLNTVNAQVGAVTGTHTTLQGLVDALSALNTGSLSTLSPSVQDIVFGQIGVTDIAGYINTLNTVNAQVGAVTGTHTTLQGLVDALSALNTGSLSTLSPSVQDIVFGQIGVTDIAGYINTLNTVNAQVGAVTGTHTTLQGLVDALSALNTGSLSTLSPSVQDIVFGQIGVTDIAGYISTLNTVNAQVGAVTGTHTTLQGLVDALSALNTGSLSTLSPSVQDIVFGQIGVTDIAGYISTLNTVNAQVGAVTGTHTTLQGLLDALSVLNTGSLSTLSPAVQDIVFGQIGVTDIAGYISTLNTVNAQVGAVTGTHTTLQGLVDALSALNTGSLSTLSPSVQDIVFGQIGVTDIAGYISTLNTVNAQVGAVTGTHTTLQGLVDALSALNTGSLSTLSPSVQDIVFGQIGVTDIAGYISTLNTVNAQVGAVTGTHTTLQGLVDALSALNTGSLSTLSPAVQDIVFGQIGVTDIAGYINTLNTVNAQVGAVTGTHTTLQGLVDALSALNTGSLSTLSPAVQDIVFGQIGVTDIAGYINTLNTVNAQVGAVTGTHTTLQGLVDALSALNTGSLSTLSPSVQDIVFGQIGVTDIAGYISTLNTVNAQVGAVTGTHTTLQGLVDALSALNTGSLSTLSPAVQDIVFGQIGVTDIAGYINTLNTVNAQVGAVTGTHTTLQSLVDALSALNTGSLSTLSPSVQDIVFGQIGVTDIAGYINTLNTVNAQVGAVTGTHTTLQGLVDALSALNTGSLSTLSPSVQDIVFGQIGVTDIASYINTLNTVNAQVGAVTGTHTTLQGLVDALSALNTGSLSTLSPSVQDIVFGQIGVTDIAGYINTLNTVNAQVGAVTGTHTTLQGLVDALSALNAGSLSTLSPAVQDIVFGQIGVTDIAGYINTLNTVNAQVGAVTGTHTTLQGLVDALSALNTGSLSTLSPSVQDIVFGQIGVTDIAGYISTLNTVNAQVGAVTGTHTTLQGLVDALSALNTGSLSTLSPSVQDIVFGQIGVTDIAGYISTLNTVNAQVGAVTGTHTTLQGLVDALSALNTGSLSTLSPSVQDIVFGQIGVTDIAGYISTLNTVNAQVGAVTGTHTTLQGLVDALSALNAGSLSTLSPSVQDIVFVQIGVTDIAGYISTLNTVNAQVGAVTGTHTTLQGLVDALSALNTGSLSTLSPAVQDIVFGQIGVTDIAGYIGTLNTVNAQVGAVTGTHTTLQGLVDALSALNTGSLSTLSPSVQDIVFGQIGVTDIAGYINTLNTVNTQVGAVTGTHTTLQGLVDALSALNAGSLSTLSPSVQDIVFGQIGVTDIAGYINTLNTVNVQVGAVTGTHTTLQGLVDALSALNTGSLSTLSPAVQDIVFGQIGVTDIAGYIGTLNTVNAQVGAVTGTHTTLQGLVDALSALNTGSLSTLSPSVQDIVFGQIGVTDIAGYISTLNTVNAQVGAVTGTHTTLQGLVDALSALNTGSLSTLSPAVQDIVFGQIGVTDIAGYISTLNTVNAQVGAVTGTHTSLQGLVDALSALNTGSLSTLSPAVQDIVFGQIGVTDIAGYINTLNTVNAQVGAVTGTHTTLQGLVDALSALNTGSLSTLSPAVQDIVFGQIGVTDIAGYINTLNTVNAQVGAVTGTHTTLQGLVDALSALNTGSLSTLSPSVQDIVFGQIGVTDIAGYINTLNTVNAQVGAVTGTHTTLQGLVDALSALNTGSLSTLSPSVQDIVFGQIGVTDIAGYISTLNTVNAQVGAVTGTHTTLQGLVDALSALNTGSLSTLSPSVQDIVFGQIGVTDIAGYISTLNTVNAQVGAVTGTHTTLQGLVDALSALNTGSLSTLSPSVQDIVFGQIGVTDIAGYINTLNTVNAQVGAVTGTHTTLQGLLDALSALNTGSLSTLSPAVQDIVFGQIGVTDIAGYINTLNTVNAQVGAVTGTHTTLQGLVDALSALNTGSLSTLSPAVQDIVFGQIGVTDIAGYISTLNTVNAQVGAVTGTHTTLQGLVDALSALNTGSLSTLSPSVQDIVFGQIGVTDIAGYISTLNTVNAQVGAVTGTHTTLQGLVDALSALNTGSLSTLSPAVQDIVFGQIGVTDIAGYISTLNTVNAQVGAVTGTHTTLQGLVDALSALNAGSLSTLSPAVQDIVFGQIGVTDIGGYINTLNTVNAQVGAVTGTHTTLQGLVDALSALNTGSLSTLSPSVQDIVFGQIGVTDIAGYINTLNTVNAQVGIALDAQTNTPVQIIQALQSIEGMYSSLANLNAQSLLNQALGVNDVAGIGTLITMANNVDTALSSTNTQQVYGTLQNIYDTISNMGAIPQQMFSDMLGVPNMNGLLNLIEAVGNVGIVLDASNGIAPIGGALQNIQQDMGIFGSTAQQLIYDLLGVSGAIGMQTFTQTMETMVTSLDASQGPQASLAGFESIRGADYTAMGSTAQNIIFQLLGVNSVSGPQSIDTIVDMLTGVVVASNAANSATTILAELNNISANYSAMSSSVQNLLFNLLGVNNSSGLAELIDIMGHAGIIEAELANPPSTWDLNSMQTSVQALQVYTGSANASNILNNFLNSLLNQYGITNITSLPGIINNEQNRRQEGVVDLRGRYGIESTEFSPYSANNQSFAESLEAAIAPLGQALITPAVAGAIIEQVLQSQDVDIFTNATMDVMIQELVNLGVSLNEIDQITRALEALRSVLVNRLQNQDVSQREAHQMVDIIMNAVDMKGVSETQKQHIKQVVLAFSMGQLLNIANQTSNESLRDLVIDLMVAGMTGDANFKNVVLGQQRGRDISEANNLDRVIKIASEIAALKESLAEMGISQSDITISTIDGVIIISLRQSVSDTVQLSSVDMVAVVNRLNEFQQQINSIASEMNMDAYALRVRFNDALIDMQRATTETIELAGMTDLAAALHGLGSADATVVTQSLETLNNIVELLLERASVSGEVMGNDIQLALHIKNRISQLMIAKQSDATALVNQIQSLDNKAETLGKEINKLINQLEYVSGNTNEARVARIEFQALIDSMQSQLLDVNSQLLDARTQLRQQNALADLLLKNSNDLELKLAGYTLFNDAYNRQMFGEIDARINDYESQLYAKLQADQVSEKLSAADIQAMEMYHYTLLQKLEVRKATIERLIEQYKAQFGETSNEYLAAQEVKNQLDAKIAQVGQALAVHVLRVAEYTAQMGEVSDYAHISQVEKAAQLNNAYRLIDSTIENMKASLSQDTVSSLQAAQSQIAQNLLVTMKAGRDMANSEMADIKADLVRLLEVVSPTSRSVAEADAAKASYLEGVFDAGAVAGMQALNKTLADILNKEIAANEKFAQEFEGKKLSERRDILDRLITEIMRNDDVQSMFANLNEKLGPSAANNVLDRVISAIMNDVAKQETKQDITVKNVDIAVNKALQHELSVSAVAWMNMLRVYNGMLAELSQSSAMNESVRGDLAILLNEVQDLLGKESSLGVNSLTYLISELGKFTELSNRQDLEYEAQLLRGESAGFLASLSGVVEAFDRYTPSGMGSVDVDMHMKQNLEKARNAMNTYKQDIASKSGKTTIEASELEARIKKDVQIVRDSVGKGGFMFEARTEEAKALVAELNRTLTAFEAARQFPLKLDQVAKMLEFVSNPLKGHEILTGGGKTSVLMHMAAIAGRIHNSEKGLIILSDENKLNEAYDAGVKRMYADLGLKVAIVKDTSEIDEAKIKEMQEADIIMTVMAVPGFLTRLAEQGNEFHAQAFEIMTNDVQIVNDEIHTVIGQSFILSQGEARKLEQTQIKALQDIGGFMDANAETLVALRYAGLIAENAAQNSNLRNEAIVRMRDKAYAEATTDQARQQIKDNPPTYTNDQIRDFILSEMLGDVAYVTQQGASYVFAKMNEYMDSASGKQLALDTAGASANQLYAMITGLGSLDALIKQAENDNIIKRYRDSGEIAYVEGLNLLTITEKMEGNNEVSLKPVFNSYVNALFAQAIGASDIQGLSNEQYKAQRAALKSFATFVTQAEGVHYGLSSDATKIVPVSFGQLDENRKFSEGYEAGIKQLFGMRQQGLVPDLQIVEINDESIQGSYEEFLFAAIANNSGLITMTGTLGMVEPMHRALGVGVDRSVSVAAIVKYWGGYVTEARAQLIARVLGITAQEVMDALGKDQFDGAAQLSENTTIEGVADLRGVMQGSMRANQNEHLVYVFHTQSTNTSDYHNEVLTQLNEIRSKDGDKARDVLIHVNQQWVQYQWNARENRYEVVNQNVNEAYVKTRMLDSASEQSAVIVTHAGDVFGMDLKTNGQTRFVDVLDTQSDLTTVLQGFGRDRGYGENLFNERDVFVIGHYGQLHAGDLLEMVLNNEHKAVQKTLLETINRTKDFMVTNTITNMINRVKNELENTQISSVQRAKLEHLATMLTNLRTKYTSEQTIDDSISDSTPSLAEDSIANGVQRSMEWLKNALAGTIGEQFNADIGGNLLDAIKDTSFAQELLVMLNAVLVMPKALDAQGNPMMNENNTPLIKADISAQEILEIKVETPKIEFRGENDFSKVDFKQHSLYGATSMAELIDSIAETIKRNELPLFAVSGGSNQALIKQLESLRDGQRDTQIARAEDLAAMDKAFAEIELDAAKEVSDPASVIGRMRDAGIIKADMTSEEYQALVDSVTARGATNFDQLKNVITEELFNTRAYQMREQVRSSLRKINNDMDEMQKQDALLPVIQYIIKESPTFATAIEELQRLQQQGAIVNISEQLLDLFNKMKDIYGLDISLDTGVANGIRVAMAGAQKVAVDVKIENGQLAYLPQIQPYIEAVLSSGSNTGMKPGALVNLLVNAQNAGVPLELDMAGIGKNKMTVVERTEKGFTAIDESGHEYRITVGAQPYSDLQFYHSVAGKELGLVITPLSVQTYDQLLVRSADAAGVDIAAFDDVMLPLAAHDERVVRRDSPWTGADIGREFEKELDIYSNAGSFMNMVSAHDVTQSMINDELKQAIRNLGSKDTAYQQRFILYMFDHFKVMNGNISDQIKSIMRMFVTELMIGTTETGKLSPIISLLYAQVAENIGSQFAIDMRRQILVDMIYERLDEKSFDQAAFDSLLVDYLFDLNLAPEALTAELNSILLVLPKSLEGHEKLTELNYMINNLDAISIARRAGDRERTQPFKMDDSMRKALRSSM
jgi:hypothetical protein